MVSWSIGTRGLADNVLRIVKATQPYPEVRSGQLEEVKNLIESQIQWLKRNNAPPIYVEVEAKGVCTDSGGLLLKFKMRKLQMDE